jgi:hypothetical protein
MWRGWHIVRSDSALWHEDFNAIIGYNTVTVLIHRKESEP